MVGRLENGPPPSTYAAQIVDNIENARSRSHSSSSRTHLKELLQRVLEADRRGIFDETVLDSSLEVNHKLICVIVRACLVLPTSQDPFEYEADVFDQARDSLAVIQLTIRRAPEVIWVSLEGADSYARPQGPLFLWLIPSLLNLLHQKIRTDVRDGAQRVLETAFSASRRSSQSPVTSLLIPNFVLDCTNGKS